MCLLKLVFLQIAHTPRVITTVIQSLLTVDPRIQSIDRKVRLVGSCFLVILAFVPVPIVLLVLILKAFSPGGLAKEETLAEGDDDPEAIVDEARATTGNQVVNGKAEVNNGKTGPLHRVKGEPKTGFGPKPVGEREIIETALLITVPASLLTFEQGVRCGQAFYTPRPGETTPWVCTINCSLLQVLTVVST